jgi:hypothetical protein
MMAWVAVDRLIRSVELGRFATDIPRWKNFAMPFTSRFDEKVLTRI